MPPTPTPSPSPFLVQLVAESNDASWLGPALLSGLFLVLGAGLALLSTYLSDSRRAKQEREQRFHDEVLAICARLVVTTGDLYKHMSALDHLVVLKEQLDERNKHFADTAIVLDKILDAVESINSDVATLRLIAPEAIRTASVEVVVHAGQIGKLASSRSPDLHDASGRLLELDIAFQDAVRKSLTADR